MFCVEFTKKVGCKGLKWKNVCILFFGFLKSGMSNAKLTLEGMAISLIDYTLSDADQKCMNILTYWSLSMSSINFLLSNAGEKGQRRGLKGVEI